MSRHVQRAAFTASVHCSGNDVVWALTSAAYPLSGTLGVQFATRSRLEPRLGAGNPLQCTASVKPPEGVAS